jgi:tripartite-type tricarboxylate transporter receptor subunit TctC
MNSRVAVARALAACLALVLVLAGPAAAQYPAKPIRFVVPFPPGGGVDIVARAVVAKSSPDGYSFLVSGIGSQAIVHTMMRSRTFDIRRDFAPVCRIGYGTIAFVVPQSSRAASVREFVAMAKAEPGKLTFASSGTGAIIHLTGELFKQAASIDLTHIPYKGTTQILPDLLDGRVDMALDSLPAYLPHIKSGKLRALAVASRGRSALLPELPTMEEAGVPGVVSATDYALYAPAGTPREIVTLMNRETNAVLQMPDLRAKLAAQGIEISGSTPEALQAELAEEIGKWAKVIKDANIEPQ